MPYFSKLLQFHRSQVVPFAIKLLQSKGYKLVTLAECLGKSPYQWTAAPGTPDVCHDLNRFTARTLLTMLLPLDSLRGTAKDVGFCFYHA